MKTYPLPPDNIDLSIAEPSPLYKKEVTKSVLAIVLFIVSYLTLISVGGILAYFCIRLGVAIISSGLHLLVLLAGGGVILIGLFIFYFLIKFIFSSQKTDRSNLLEIHEQEQPQLFEFIKRITQETQAPFPKKIYLSNEVNASVFYDSSFWSMFIPVRKNLLIGLGLVNSVNLSEFKAILAHEFGHFSQKSMKVGSYVYNSNRIIYNLLYDNTSFFSTINKIAGIHLILTLCMHVVAGVVTVIQKLLNQLYLFINAQNSKLSREMEFHADSVAAMVSGSKPLVNALYRLELAEASFGYTLETCNLILDENKRERNIFPTHHYIMKEMALKNKIPIIHHQPLVNKDTFSDFNFTRVNIENQWASHPATALREEALLKLNVQAEEVYESAWDIFSNAENVQTEMTNLLYQNATIAHDKLSTGDYASQKYKDQSSHYELPEETKGYWDSKPIPEMNLEEISLSHIPDVIYTDENSKLNMKLSALEQDMALLKGIIDKQIKPSSIEYMGEKYPRKDAETLYTALSSEKETLQTSIESFDAKALSIHYLRAKQHHEEEAFKSDYNSIIKSQQNEAKALKYRENILEWLNPLFEGREVSIDAAREMIRNTQNEELNLKELCKTLIANPDIVSQLKPHTINRLQAFIDSTRIYFLDNTFQDEAIRELIATSSFVGDAFSEWHISLKRKVLSY